MDTILMKCEKCGSCAEVYMCIGKRKRDFRCRRCLDLEKEAED